MPDHPQGETAIFRWNGVSIDCGFDDFEAMIVLYRDMFGLVVAEREAHYAALIDPAGGRCINIGAHEWYEPPVWPEVHAKQSKMMHFEVRVDDVPSAVALAVSLGAREARHQSPDRDQTRLRVMVDPAGHPFCLWS